MPRQQADSGVLVKSLTDFACKIKFAAVKFDNEHQPQVLASNLRDVLANTAIIIRERFKIARNKFSISLRRKPFLLPFSTC